jgi:hypothetical protein
MSVNDLIEQHSIRAISLWQPERKKRGGLRRERPC